MGKWLDGFKAIKSPVDPLPTEAKARAIAISLWQTAQAEYVLATDPLMLPEIQDYPDTPPIRNTGEYHGRVEDYYWWSYYVTKVWYTSIVDGADQPVGTPRLAWGTSTEYDAVRSRIASYEYEQLLSVTPLDYSDPTVQKNVTETRQGYEQTIAEGEAVQQHQDELAAANQAQADAYIAAREVEESQQAETAQGSGSDNADSGASGNGGADGSASDGGADAAPSPGKVDVGNGLLLLGSILAIAKLLRWI